jgi:hypothetical protein
VPKATIRFAFTLLLYRSPHLLILVSTLNKLKPSALKCVIRQKNQQFLTHLFISHSANSIQIRWRSLYRWVEDELMRARSLCVPACHQNMYRWRVFVHYARAQMIPEWSIKIKSYTNLLTNKKMSTLYVYLLFIRLKHTQKKCFQTIYGFRKLYFLYASSSIYGCGQYGLMMENLIGAIIFVLKNNFSQKQHCWVEVDMYLLILIIVLGISPHLCPSLWHDAPQRRP